MVAQFKPHLTVNPAKGKPETVTLKVGDVLRAYRNGEIEDYSKNRGTVAGYDELDGIKVNTSLRKQMRERGISAERLGTITVAAMGEGKYKIADGHSRISAMLYLLETEYDEDFSYIENLPIVVTFVHGDTHLETYQSLNSGKPHSGANKVSNTDFIPGSIVHPLIEATGASLAGTRMWQAVWHHIFAANKVYEISVNALYSFSSIKLYKGSADAFKDVFASQQTLMLAPEVLEKISAALVYYSNLQAYASNLCTTGAISKTVKTAICSVGCMHLILLDHYNQGVLTTQREDVLLLKIAKNYDKCDKKFGILSQANDKNGAGASVAIQELSAMLSPRTRVKVRRTALPFTTPRLIK